MKCSLLSTYVVIAVLDIVITLFFCKLHDLGVNCHFITVFPELYPRYSSLSSTSTTNPYNLHQDQGPKRQHTSSTPTEAISSTANMSVPLLPSLSLDDEASETNILFLCCEHTEIQFPSSPISSAILKSLSILTILSSALASSQPPPLLLYLFTRDWERHFG